MMILQYLPNHHAAAASSSPFQSPFYRPARPASVDSQNNDDDGAEQLKFPPPSTSSTRTLSSNNKRTTAQKKRVRFQDAPTKSQSNPHVIEAEDYNILWYSVAQIEALKGANMAYAGKVVWDDRRKKPCRDSYQSIMKRTYQACCDCLYETDSNLLSRRDEKQLQSWLDCEPNRLGTERKTVATIGRDKRHRRSRLVDLVFLIQEMQDKADADTIAEILSQSCEAISRPSRLFARHLAEAHAASCRQ